MKIAVIGTGYAGLVSGTCFAEWGHDVVCFDKNVQKIASLRQGKLPVYEPELDELVERNCASGQLDFTCNLADAVEGAAIVFIAVGTPLRVGHGDTDLSSVHMTARELAPLVADNTVIAVKSTVPVGTADMVRKIIATAGKAGAISIASNPDFLREGFAVRDFLAPDRIIIGVEDERACRRLVELYDSPPALRNTPLIVTTRRTAELIKCAANAFLATKITFINELADLCEEVGSDVSELALGMGLDKRIGTNFLTAGPGYGGSCFPKDTLALLQTARDHGVALRIVEETVAVNDARKRRMARKVTEAFGGDIEGLTIAILGLTVRPDTDEVGDAPSVQLIEALQRLGGHIRAYDPVGIENASKILDGVDFFDDLYECTRDADAVVIMTEWETIKKMDLVQLKEHMRQPILIDLRNALDLDAAQRLEFHISTIGKSASLHGDLKEIARRAGRPRTVRTREQLTSITVREK
ncbi:UDP-glucose/GDP-mannose dehydrogenase family protein [Rhizobium sp. P44RR-XXIV]|uniref:UDP-glucose dehydrogenase family protein n=1 Tax=Rhizobium sp. P44RR-XXIV TaxID=1921145 RepID=UPI000986875D|nr:UDP-glucose/GDP-mannose dehydrogenase family protein [Rhizobium sp. P44RR-XXIV]TIX90857.1 UDP-glucose/GDP-mannose dehydrogenase family protein [Rhizobium sp. P44RR-XXIV]